METFINKRKDLKERRNLKVEKNGIGEAYTKKLHEAKRKKILSKSQKQNQCYPPLA